MKREQIPKCRQYYFEDILIGIGGLKRYQMIKAHCARCYPESSFERRSYQIVKRESLTDLCGFEQIYRKFDNKFCRLGVDLPFRHELDSLIATELLEMLPMDVVGALVPGSNIYCVESEELNFVLLRNQLLEELGNLLGRLVWSLGGHSQSAVLSKLSEFLFLPQSESQLVSPSAPPSETTAAMQKLFSQEWPLTIAHFERGSSPFVAETWSFKKPHRPVSTAKTQAFLVWSRNQRNWRKLVGQSTILKPRETQFLASLVPLLSRGRILAVIDEEAGSATKFREAAEGHIDTMLLINSDGNRFGFFLLGSWVEDSVSGVENGFMFSLSQKRKVLIDKKVCMNFRRLNSIFLGPSFASLINRLRRFS